MVDTAPGASAADRRQKRLIAASTSALLLLVVGILAADLWSSRARALAQARSRATNLSYVLSESIRRAFFAADASLRQLAVHSRRVGGPDAPSSEWSTILAASRIGVTGVGSISVADRTGLIRHSTIQQIVGESRRDDYIFVRQSAATTDELTVSTPFLTNIGGPRRYIIPIGRRLTDASGAFDGIVVVSMTPEDQRGFFRTVDVGSQGIIWVLHPNGQVLFREPSAANPIGESALQNPIYTAASASGKVGTVDARLAPGGPVFISAFHVVSEPPLIVAVSLSQDEVLHDWQAERRVSLLGLAALIVTVGLTVFLLFRQIDAKTRVEQTLAEARLLEAIRLRDANERLSGALDREQRARRETEAASYVKDQFLMTVSHELRTPINAIYGWARMMAAGRISEEQRDRALATIERNARVQTRLIDDLLDVSRVISGKLRLDVRAVNPAEVISAAVDAVRPALTAKDVHFECTMDPAAGSMAADPERLQQIVWNLLSNAVKFTPEGGTVRLELTRRGAQIEIVVHDTGIGISPEFLPFVFDRFRQQESGSGRRYGGLGLGLAIVRHLVELHGGSVTAESEGDGRGSTFRVLLPVGSDAHAAQVRTTRGRAVEESEPRPLDGVRVLVVDDDPEARELFATILRDAGAIVSTAASADEALTILDEAGQDVLVSDIEMPVQDGYDLVQKALAAAARRGERLTTVAVTAYARPQDRARAFEAGYHSHLPKPIEPAELISVVASLGPQSAGQ